MRSKATFISCLCAAMGAAYALNPIHEASYNLLPRGNFANTATFSTAALYRSDHDWVGIPLSLTFRATSRFELGGGLKTFWGDGASDHIPHLVVGAKYQIPGGTSLQADLLVGLTSATDDGLSFGFHHRFGYSSRFYSRLTGRLGFLPALVDDDALMAMEIGFYPTVNIMRPLSLELGLISSSQTRRFDDHFALDLQPALLVHMGRESVVETAVTVGLAGDRKEELRVKVALIYGF